MAKEPAGAAMSEDSIAYLEEVKKGKPRKFAMICKGANIVSLVIYKKGNVEKRKKEAKEAGKGQFYFGVVDGKGVAIRFVLARADGFESEPVKNTVLKGFLDEAGGLKCKPFFEIVETAPVVLDEDDPLVARFLKLQQASLAVCETHPDRAAEINSLCKQIGHHLDQEQADEATSQIDGLERLLGGMQAAAVESARPAPTDTPPPGPDIPTAPSPPPTPTPTSNDLAAQFMARLKVLKPVIDAAMAAPGADPAIKVRFSEMAGFARQKEFEQAQQLLEQVAAMLPSAPAAASPLAGDAAAFMARLKSLKPSIDAAIATPGANPDIKVRFSEVAVFARQKEFASANQLLDQVEALLRSATNAAPSADDANSAAQFMVRLKALKPTIDAAIAAPGANPEIKARFSEAAVFARKKEFAPANQLLDQVEALMASVASSSQTSPIDSQGSDSEASSKTDTSGEISNVAFQQSLLLWDAARKQIAAELKELGREVLELFANDDRLAEIQSNTYKLDDVLGDYAEELRDRLDEAYNAPAEEKSKLREEALGVLQRYRAYLNSAPFIKAVASNPVKPIDIDGVLGKTLDDVAKKLSA